MYIHNKELCIEGDYIIESNLVNEVLSPWLLTDNRKKCRQKETLNTWYVKDRIQYIYNSFNSQKDVVTQFWSLLNEVIVPYTPVSSPETSQNHS